MKFARIKKERDDLQRDVHEAESKAHQARRIKDDCELTMNRLVPALN